MSEVRRLLRFLLPYWKWVGLSVLLGVATIASGIGLMGTSAFLIARAALHPSIAVLQVAIVGVRFFGISRGIFRYLERLTSHEVNFKLLSQIRVWFYKCIEPLAPAGLLYAAGGDLLSRAIADVDTLEDFYVRVVSPPLVAIIVSVGMGVFVGIFDPALALVVVAGLVLCATLAPLILFTANRRQGKALIEERGLLNEILVESIQGLSDLLAYGHEVEQIKKVQDAVNRLGKIQLRLAQFRESAAALNGLITNLTLWAVLWVAIRLVGQGKLDGVSLAVLALLTMASFEAVIPLSQSSQVLQSSLQAARRLFSVADAPIRIIPPVLPCPPPISPDLVIRNLCFQYDSSQPWVLENLRLNLPSKKKMAIVGVSGSGKTTLFNLLLRFWDYQIGSIELNGVDIRQYTPADIRDQISLVSQSTYLFSATLRQNLRLAKQDVKEDELISVIDRVGLGDWLALLPDGLDSWLGENGVQMSSGERQRLAIARAILHDRPLLLLDEPTANLDAMTEQQIIQLLVEVSEERSLLWVTHRLSGLDRMDEILVLNNGKVVERGSQQALLAQKGLYSRMWEIQSRLLV
ncbi:MAG: thiol reductant ABC exporter subunit CydC [Anaerolineaceae bacterium]|nr:thiol reductant ABC exporter subunit CydC [Anaerolineaceae bacterium]